MDFIKRHVSILSEYIVCYKIKGTYRPDVICSYIAVVLHSRLNISNENTTP